MRKGNLTQVIESWYFKENEGMETSNGSLYHMKNELYSYGNHYLLATKLNNGGYLVNTDRYSSTTNKHRCYTKRVLRFAKTVNVSMSALFNILGNKDLQKLSDMEIVERCCNIDKCYDKTLLKLGKRLFLVGYDETLKGVNNEYVIEIDNKFNTPTQKIDTVALALETVQPYEGVKRIGMKYFLELNCPIQGEKNFEFCDSLGNKYIASEGVQVGNEIYVKGIVKNENYKQCKLYDDVKNKKWHLVAEGNFIKADRGL